MEHKQDKTVMPWILAKAYGEEPDALIALVRVCGGVGGQPPALPGEHTEVGDKNCPFFVLFVSIRCVRVSLTSLLI